MFKEKGKRLSVWHGVVALAAFLVMMIGSTLYLSAVAREDQLKIGVNEYPQVTDRWITNQGQEVHFPQKLLIGEDGVKSISCTLPSEIRPGDAIVYDAHYCGQLVYVNDELIYSVAATPTMPFGKTRGNAKVLVPMFRQYEGQTLRIEFINPFGTSSTNFDGIYFGPAGEFKFTLLYQNVWRIVMAASFLAVAVTIMIFGISHIVTRSSATHTFSFFYFASLAGAVSAWLMSDPAVVQMFSNKTTVGQFVAFLSLLSIGVYDMGLCACIMPRRAMHFHSAELVGYILTILYIALYITDTVDLVSFSPVILVYGAFCVIFSWTLSAMELKDNRVAHVVFFGSMVLIIGVGIAIGMFVADPMNSNSIWPIVGAFSVYVLLLFILLMRYEQSILKQSKDSETYWKMAYTDQLTGLANRAAMEKTFDSLEEVRDESHDILFFMADLNDLKKTNDSLGHEAGDALIKAAADCFANVFDKNKELGKSVLSFRLGGDEFAAVVVDATQPTQYFYDRLDEELEKKRQAGVPISMAVGHAICRYPDDEVSLRSGLYRAADGVMYEKKIAMKLGRL